MGEHSVLHLDPFPFKMFLSRHVECTVSPTKCLLTLAGRGVGGKPAEHASHFCAHPYTDPRFPLHFACIVKKQGKFQYLVFKFLDPLHPRPHRKYELQRHHHYIIRREEATLESMCLVAFLDIE